MSLQLVFCKKVNIMMKMMREDKLLLEPFLKLLKLNQNLFANLECMLEMNCISVQLRTTLQLFALFMRRQSLSLRNILIRLFFCLTICLKFVNSLKSFIFSKQLNSQIFGFQNISIRMCAKNSLSKILFNVVSDLNSWNSMNINLESIALILNARKRISTILQ